MPLSPGQLRTHKPHPAAWCCILQLKSTCSWRPPDTPFLQAVRELVWRATLAHIICAHYLCTCALYCSDYQHPTLSTAYAVMLHISYNTVATLPRGATAPATVVHICCRLQFVGAVLLVHTLQVEGGVMTCC